MKPGQDGTWPEESQAGRGALKKMGLKVITDGLEHPGLRQTEEPRRIPWFLTSTRVTRSQASSPFYSGVYRVSFVIKLIKLLLHFCLPNHSRKKKGEKQSLK